MLVLGLGNPGPRYARTRHNIGWRVLDLLVERWRARPLESVAEYDAWRAAPGDRCVDLLKPLTFMNLSGEALRAYRDRHGLESEGLLVVTDDVYLPLGHVRLRAAGSPGGHRGLESIQLALEGGTFARLRIGVGAAADAEALREHVLETFDDDEERIAEDAIHEAADAVDCWAREGVGPAMNRFNRRVRREVPES